MKYGRKDLFQARDGLAAEGQSEPKFPSFDIGALRFCRFEQMINCKPQLNPRKIRVKFLIKSGLIFEIEYESDQTVWNSFRLFKFSLIF